MIEFNRDKEAERKVEHVGDRLKPRPPRAQHFDPPVRQSVPIERFSDEELGIDASMMRAEAAAIGGLSLVETGINAMREERSLLLAATLRATELRRAQAENLTNVRPYKRNLMLGEI